MLSLHWCCFFSFDGLHSKWWNQLLWCRYADRPHCYWTGYFTSRSAFKGYVRKLSGFLQVSTPEGILSSCVCVLLYHECSFDRLWLGVGCYQTWKIWALKGGLFFYKEAFILKTADGWIVAKCLWARQQDSWNFWWARTKLDPIPTVLRKQWQSCSIMMEWVALRSSMLQMIMLNDWQLDLQRWW